MRRYDCVIFCTFFVHHFLYNNYRTIPHVKFEIATNIAWNRNAEPIIFINYSRKRKPA